MDNWLTENLLVFVLAGFSGFDILKRFSLRVREAIVDLPLKCQLKIAAGLAVGRRVDAQACRKQLSSGVKYAEADF